MQRITSRHNTLVVQYRDVARGDHPDLMLLDGAHLVGDALGSGVRLRHLAVGVEAATDSEIEPLVARALERRVDVALASAPVMAALSPVRSPSRIVALAERPSGEARLFGTAHAVVLVACDVQDPGNLGAMARVAESAGASGLVAAGQSADPFGWKALRGSMGSALRLPIVRRARVEEAIALARDRGCRVLAAVPRGGRSVFGADLAGRVAILVGGEGPGLSATTVALADDRLTIPMQAPVESLNAAVTAALIVYEARRQRG